MTYELDLLDLSLDAAADLSSDQFKLVTQNSSGQAALATTAGEKCIGVLYNKPDAANLSAQVRVQGLAKVLYGETIAVDDYLATNASGLAVVASGDDHVVGRAMVAGVVNDVGVMLAPAGSQPGSLRAPGTIVLPIANARELVTNEYVNTAGNAGALSNDTTPLLEAVNPGTDQASRLVWAAGNTDKIAWPVVLPADLDSAQDVTVHAMALSGGATDTPALAVEAFFGVGDSDAGGNTGALSSTLAEVTATIAAADVPAPPNFATITLAPGTHATDSVILYGVWLEYQRKAA